MGPARRIAVVLFNLGGPDNLGAVEPYLVNLFGDPAILGAPSFIRPWLARLIAHRRAPVAREIFAQLGGGSPILAQTEAQAEALAHALERAGIASEARVFIAMRYWHPRAREAAASIASYAPDCVILLPLYPQYSTATSASSIAEFELALSAAGYAGEMLRICCFPRASGLIAAFAGLLRPALDQARLAGLPRVLFSAHGLPERIVRKGDPYVWQVEETARLVAAALGEPLDWSVCYQSRVGPLKWTGPSIDEAIAKAVADGRVPVLVPISFVSEHSETLVELDGKYRDFALKLGAKGYARVPALGTAPAFIQALAGLVRESLACAGGRHYCNPRICPAHLRACPNRT